jgi:hypothetical protein
MNMFTIAPAPWPIVANIFPNNLSNKNILMMFLYVELAENLVWSIDR